MERRRLAGRARTHRSAEREGQAAALTTIAAAADPPRHGACELGAGERIAFGIRRGSNHELLEHVLLGPGQPDRVVAVAVDRLRRAYASLLVVQVLADWRHAPTGLVPAHHPPLLVAALTVAALAVAGWAVCDGLAALRWCSRTAAAP